MSSIEQVPVVLLKEQPNTRTVQRKSKGYHIIARRCKVEGLEAQNFQKSDAQQASRRAEIQAARTEGREKQRSTQRSFINRKKKLLIKIF